ncbi:MAG: ATP-binding protein [Myxococcota bacterium]|jgi:two-component system sensor histidine kinase CpxA|nr:ATP-binding protein [Myxococcota bacterium]
MQSLFLRIFLSFWGAMSVIGVSFALIAASDEHSPRRERFEFLATQALELEASRTEQLLMQGDTEAAAEQWRALESRLLIHAHLIEVDSIDTHHELPKPLVELARELAAMDGEEACKPEGLRAGCEQQRLRDASSAWQSYDDYHGFVAALPRAMPTHILIVELPRPKWWDFVFSPTSLFLRLFIILATSGLVCYALARYIAKPVMHLRDATHRLAAGESSVRVGPKLRRRRDELGTLGRDFDSMAQRLEQLLAAQHRLLRDVSHELRSPLARLNVALELARTANEAQQSREMLDRIERESERLAALIAQLMTLTRIDTQGERFPKQTVDLSELLRELVEDARFEARALDKDVSLESEDGVRVHGVPELLRSAIENVLRNALRHSPVHAEVQVRLLESEGAAQIVVRDFGEGVPEALLSQIFQPFVRVEEARDRRSGGTGLGLAITEGAMRLHEGWVKAENMPEGGLQVLMCLPLQRASLQ